LFFLLINKFNLCFVYILQYLLQFSLDIYYCAERLYIISNILFKLFVLKDKYNKNKLLTLNKVDNFATNIKTIIRLIVGLGFDINILVRPKYLIPISWFNLESTWVNDFLTQLDRLAKQSKMTSKSQDFLFLKIFALFKLLKIV